ncbi:MAG: hypothetical protein B7Y23_10055 [Sulfurovum sp. 16-42-52]|nr:MAG: hypothetical protein B7Y63_09570 [Sulfurovum sp. 35-42-20]OYZ23595.1 MAG: hypothetical protein B7Y23_10055 [Sulfurovum sp. 16-42-52]OZA42885.1 MAG: hypothetical protein B7X80_09935 [Sulfurovum sp. 17-42-90]
MIYTIQTTTNIETVKSELERKAKEVGFGLLNTYDFKTILEEKSFPIEKEITVFELCNPPGAQQALTKLPEISVYLPCRISMYENNGMTALSTIGIEEIINAVEAKEEFKTYMIILFENLKRVMRSWDT